MNKQVQAAVALTCLGVFLGCSGDGNSDVEPPSTPSQPDAGDSMADATSRPARDAAVRMPSPCSKEQWCSIPAPEGEYLNSVWPDGAGGAWAATAQGIPFVTLEVYGSPLLQAARTRLLRWTGDAWTTVMVSAPFDLSESFGSLDLAWAGRGLVWGSGPADMWALLGTQIYHGTGSGPDSLTWLATSTPTGVPVVRMQSLSGSSASDVWAVGGAAVLRSTDGATFQRMTISAAAAGTTFHQVYVVAPGDVWVGGYDATAESLVLFRGIQSGMSWGWTKISLPSDVATFDDKFATPLRLDALRVEASGAVWVARRTDPATKAVFSDNTGMLIPPGYGRSLVARGTVTGTTYSVDKMWPCTDCGPTPQIVYTLTGGGEGTLSAGQGLGSVGLFGTTGFQLVDITRDGVPEPGPFYSVHRSDNGEAWAVGGTVALHKKGGQP